MESGSPLHNQHSLIHEEAFWLSGPCTRWVGPGLPQLHPSHFHFWWHGSLFTSVSIKTLLAWAAWVNRVKCLCCCRISSGNWKCPRPSPVLGKDRPVKHLHVLSPCECFNYRYNVYICRIFHKAYTPEITHTTGGKDCVFSNLILSLIFSSCLLAVLSHFQHK